MTTSETYTELIVALNKAHAKFTKLSKDKTAKAGQYSYDYADLPAVLDATMPALLANGLVLTQAADWDPELSMLMLVTRLWHTSGQWLETRYPLKTYDKPQEQGSSLTYAKRYALGALLAVAAADEDDDAQTAQQAKPVAAPPPKPAPPVEGKPAPVKKGSISEAQQKRLFAIARGAGWTSDDMKTALRVKWGIAHTNEINWSAYDAICAFFQKSPDRVAADEAEAEALAQADAEARLQADDDDRPPF